MRPANAALDWSTTGTASFTTSGDLAEAALYSNPISLRHLSAFSVQLVATGSPTGSFKLQMSNDNPDHTGNKYPTSTMNWTDLDGSSISITTSGNVGWNATGAGYLWLRVVWTKTSGTGSITGRFNGKGET